MAKKSETAMTLRPSAGLTVLFLFASAAHAGTAEELTAAINKCAAIADDAVRHTCYDQLSALVKAPAPGTAAEASPPVAAQPEAPTPTEEKGTLAGGFGLFGSVEMPADRITATVESFTFDYGVFVVALDNGQVWRQVAAIGDIVHLGRDRKNKVTIWPSPFGDYALKIEGYHTTYRVRRIK